MNTALLIIDIQNDYFEHGANALSQSLEASEQAKALLLAFRERHWPVIHVQHLAKSPTATFFKPNTLGAEIHQNVKPIGDEKIVVKHFPNGFKETDLLGHLQSNAITNLVICGMMTHMCVDATTRAAKDFGYNCTLIADACATKNLELNGSKVNADAVQLSFLAALNYHYAKVVNAQQYLNELE